MVHTFEFDGVVYLYDTASGSLHICDALTAEVVKKTEGREYDLEGAPEDAVREIEEELRELKEKGLLFGKDPEEAPAKSGLVKALCLHVAHDCNLACEYCFASEGTYRGERARMSEEVARRAVDFLIRESGNRRILEIDFFGGEPLMNFDVVKSAVEYAKAEAAKVGKKFLFTLTTNGLLLRGETAEWINGEMENVVLSLDGRKEVHDAVRKTVTREGSFDRVFPNIRDFVKKRGDRQYYVRGTFTAKNPDFGNDVLFLADQGFREISMEPVVLPEDHPLHIPDSALPGIREEYRRLAKAYIERRKNGRGFRFFHFSIDLEGGPCLRKRVSACGAGNEYFSVVPNGDIYPCHQFADESVWKMGNVFEGKIDARLREKFACGSLFTRKGCETCFARFHCSGGCAANNARYMGDVNVPYPPTCEMMRARMECALAVYAAEKEKNL